MTTLTNTALNTLAISKGALAHNVQALRNHLPEGCEIMAMVKANGYGTDSLLLTQALSKLGVTYFGVATVGEGEMLRAGGVSGKILTCFCTPEAAEAVLENNLQVAVWSHELIDALESTASPLRPAKVHLFINTGMNRFGCRPDEVEGLLERINVSPHLHLEGIMTHLASADAPLRDPQTRKQLADFKRIFTREDATAAAKAPLIHALNSAGALRFDFPESNLVRVGLALFGLYASEATRTILPLECALSLTSQLVHIQTCEAGERVSYGGHHIVHHKTRIGIVPLGYFDGLHQAYTGCSLTICGKPAPIIGAICMDFLMCDLTRTPDAGVGSAVVVFDGEHRPESLAASAGKSVYELITCLGPRIRRMLTP